MSKSPQDASSTRFDPKHPAILSNGQLSLKTLPTFFNKIFNLRAVPKATLWKPDIAYPPPPIPLRIRLSDQRIDMSLLKWIGSKSVHKHAVVRNRVGRRLKQALHLVVTYGANARVDGRGKPAVVLSSEHVPENLVLKDWTYVISPKLEVYNIPMPLLVSELHAALIRVRKQANLLEKRWGPARYRAPVDFPPTQMAKQTRKKSAPISRSHDAPQFTQNEFSDTDSRKEGISRDLVLNELRAAVRSPNVKRSDSFSHSLNDFETNGEASSEDSESTSRHLAKTAERCLRSTGNESGAIPDGSTSTAASATSLLGIRLFGVKPIIKAPSNMGQSRGPNAASRQRRDSQ